MASENQVPVHSSGKAQGSLVVFILGISLTDPHPIPSRGASVLHGAQNNKREIKAFPAAAAWAKQGAGIPNFHPNVLLDTWCRHQGWGRGCGKEGPPLAAPWRRGAPCIAPPPSRAGVPWRRRSRRGRVSRAGRAARSPAGRAGTSEGLVHPPDAAVQLQHPQRRHARPAGPPGASPSAARPFRRSLVPPARPALRGPGAAAARAGCSLGEPRAGWAPQDEATPGSAGPAAP